MYALLGALSRKRVNESNEPDSKRHLPSQTIRTILENNTHKVDEQTFVCKRLTGSTLYSLMQLLMKEVKDGKEYTHVHLKSLLGSVQITLKKEETAAERTYVGEHVQAQRDRLARDAPALNKPDGQTMLLLDYLFTKKQGLPFSSDVYRASDVFGRGRSILKQSVMYMDEVDLLDVAKDLSLFMTNAQSMNVNDAASPSYEVLNQVSVEALVDVPRLAIRYERPSDGHHGHERTLTKT
jgi:hypothetical protein